MANLEQTPRFSYSCYGCRFNLRCSSLVDRHYLQNFNDRNLPIVVMSEITKKWYVVRTAGGKEKKVMLVKFLSLLRNISKLKMEKESVRREFSFQAIF